MEMLALFAALVLVLLNGFFVATEFALVKVRPTRIEELVRKGRPGAKLVRNLMGNVDAYLSATQLGITLASLGLGWIGEPAFSALMAAPLAWAGVTDPVWVHRIALTVAFGVITFLHIVVGELAPKSLAILRAESVAMAAAYPMRFFYVLFFPLIWTLNGVAGRLLKLFGLSTSAHTGDHHSEEEIRIILSQARSAGLLGASRADLLGRALSLPTKTARHLMVPRNDVVVLDANIPWSENIERAMTAGHTRYPLCERELDDIIGVVDIREALLEQERKGKEGVDLRALAQKPTYFPEMMSAEKLLAEFRTRKARMAVVVDEYGGASGIVTVDDVVTAVMGEMGNTEGAEVIQLSGGAYEVDGIATLEEVAQALKISLDTDTMHTVAGFLIEKLGRLPRTGDRILEQGFTFTAADVAGPRVKTVRIQQESPATTPHMRPTLSNPADKSEKAVEKPAVLDPNKKRQTV